MQDISVEYFAALLGASLGLAGLTSLISLFRFRQNAVDTETHERLTEAETLRLKSIILMCQLVGMMAILPLGMAHISSDYTYIWGISSLYFVAASIAVIRHVVKHHRYTTKMPFVNVKTSVSLIVLISLICVWNGFNIINMIFRWNEGPSLASAYIVASGSAFFIINYRLYLFLDSVTKPKSEEGPPAQSPTNRSQIEKVLVYLLRLEH